jgi:hypothetical protein
MTCRVTGGDILSGTAEACEGRRLDCHCWQSAGLDGWVTAMSREQAQATVFNAYINFV